MLADMIKTVQLAPPFLLLLRTHFLFFSFKLVRVVIGARLVRAALRDGLGAFHHQRSADAADIAGGLRLDRVFALRIIRA